MSECERGKRVLFEQKEVSRSQWVTSFNWIESCAAELLNYYCNIVALNGDLQGQNRYWNWWWAIQKKKKKDEKKKTKCFPWEYQSHSSLAPAFQTNKLLAPLWGRFSTKMPIDTQSNSSLVNLLASPFEMAWPFIGALQLKILLSHFTCNTAHSVAPPPNLNMNNNNNKSPGNQIQSSMQYSSHIASYYLWPIKRHLFRTTNCAISMRISNKTAQIYAIIALQAFSSLLRSFFLSLSLFCAIFIRTLLSMGKLLYNVLPSCIF